MTAIGRHITRHEISIDAPADVVYQIVADATAWPQRFAPTVQVEREDLGDGSERLRIWAVADLKVHSWTSRRELSPEDRVIRFRQEVSSAPVAAMGGTWRIMAAGARSSQLVLCHEFAAINDDPAGVEWIRKVTDRNSTTELSNIKALAESWDALPGLMFSFEDSVLVDGPRHAVYDFLYDAKLWAERLPHVARIELHEPTENVQWMSMDTKTKDGSAHTTESVRICTPDERIVYKQLLPPSLMTAHTGVWAVEETGSGVRATSSHTVTLKPQAISAVLGTKADVATAKDFVRSAAGGNSQATLALAKAYAEGHHG